MYLKFWTFIYERNIFSNSILFKNIVPNTNKNKYYKFLKILYYFQYKPTNILIPFLVKKAIKETFRSFERSEFQAYRYLKSKGFLTSFKSYFAKIEQILGLSFFCLKLLGDVFSCGRVHFVDDNLLSLSSPLTRSDRISLFVTVPRLIKLRFFAI